MLGAKVVVQFVDANVGGRQGSTVLVNAYRPHFRVGDEGYLSVAFSGDASNDPMQLSIRDISRRTGLALTPLRRICALAMKPS